MDAKKIGKAIAFLRTYHGMTQKKLAMKINVTDKAVSRWERGMGTPDISLLTKLAQILDVDIESLLAGNLTHFDMNWKGILYMKYPEGLAADTLIYDKRIVYFQLSLFLLAGIKEICLRGNQQDISFVKKELGDGGAFGLILTYEEITETIAEDKMVNIFFESNNVDGMMLIDTPSFLYGKDLTKTFRRIIYDSETATELSSFKGEKTGVKFFFKNKKVKIQDSRLEHGMIAFPLKGLEDVFDVGVLIKILEKHQGEKINDLKEIAEKRNLLAKND